MTAKATYRDVPVSLAGAVVGIERTGAYWRIDLLAPEIASAAQPGQFVAVAVGDGLGMPLRRFFSILASDPAAGTIQILVAVHNPGTRWLSHRRVGDKLDVLGPLGRPFPKPEPDSDVAVIAGGHGVAAVQQLTVDSADRGVRVHLVLGAASVGKVFGLERLQRLASTVAVATDDGSLGCRGVVTDLAETLLRRGVAGVYACGPMPMLAAVARLAHRASTPCWVATEARMACATGLCMTCVLPMRDDDGRVEMTRACVEGPILRADRVCWEALGQIPADCVGAAAP